MRRQRTRGPLGLASPDGSNTIALHPAGARDGRTTPTFAVARHGRPILAPSAFSITLDGRGDIAVSANPVQTSEDSVDLAFEMPWGKNRRVRDRFSRLCVRFESPGEIRWNLEIRAYDDGVAFRYELPEQPGLSRFVLRSESTEYRLADAPTLLLAMAPSFGMTERLYLRSPLALVPSGPIISLPMLAQWPDGTSAVVTEAALRDFAGMSLRRAPLPGDPCLQAVLSPRIDRAGVAVIGQTPHRSPWRVIMLADRAGAQLEGDLLSCLNDPPKGDFSWVKPGKTTWHWWNGTAEEGLTLGSQFTTFAYHRDYIDFCARHGIAYHAVVSDDRPWYAQTRTGFAPGPDTDVTLPRGDLELARIVDYGRTKGVGIRLWVHWQPLEAQLETALAQYEAWGIQGLMADFLDRDDQRMVDFCWRAVEAAARHHLNIQFHGSYKPTGEHRTFPNLFNREGALNLEYLKESMKCDPQHNVDVAFTRGMAGQTDYHLGGFRSVSRNEFRPRNIKPVVLGTRCHHLALYLVFDNPMPQVCDLPAAYEGEPGFELIESMPVSWDETRFIDGQLGEFLVVARRDGGAWYIGGITNDLPRRLSIPLDSLGSGTRAATVFRDGSMDPDDPNAIRIEHRDVAAGDSLVVDLATGGGFVAIVRER